MEATTLGDSRQALSHCFPRARDALFEVADALLTAGATRSVVETIDGWSKRPGQAVGWVV